MWCHHQIYSSSNFASLNKGWSFNFIKTWNLFKSQVLAINHNNTLLFNWKSYANDEESTHSNGGKHQCAPQYQLPTSKVSLEVPTFNHEQNNMFKMQQPKKVAMLAFKFGMLANAKGGDKCNAYEGEWQIRKNYIVNWWCWWIENCCNRDGNRYPMIYYLTSMTRSSPS